MPEASGIDKFELLRRREASRYIPVVVLSAGTSHMQINEAMAMGDDLFVFKSAIMQELETAIAGAMERRMAIPSPLCILTNRVLVCLIVGRE